jgi:hypothetical protein
VRAPEVSIGRPEIAHLLIGDAAREHRQCLPAGAAVDALLQQGQRLAAIALAQPQEALVQPGVR